MLNVKTSSKCWRICDFFLRCNYCQNRIAIRCYYEDVCGRMLISMTVYRRGCDWRTLLASNSGILPSGAMCEESMNMKRSVGGGAVGLYCSATVMISDGPSVLSVTTADD